MENDSVTIAFDMILAEINKVATSVNDQGAQFFKNGSYDDAAKLVESGRKLIDFKEKLVSLKGEWVSGLDIGTRKKVNLESIKTISFHNKSPKTGLRVTLPTGNTIHSSTAAETFTNTLLEIGLEKIIKLNKFVCKVPLVTKNKDNKYNQSRIGGYYIMTHSNTASKKQMLEEISKELGIRIRAEILK